MCRLVQNLKLNYSKLYFNVPDVLRKAINSQRTFADVGIDVWPCVELYLAPFTHDAVKQAQAVLIESIKRHLVSGALEKQANQLPSNIVTKLGVDNVAKHFKQGFVLGYH